MCDRLFAGYVVNMSIVCNDLSGMTGEISEVCLYTVYFGQSVASNQCYCECRLPFCNDGPLVYSFLIVPAF